MLRYGRHRNNQREPRWLRKGASQILRKAVIIGWIIELAGMALWLYGYFATGNPSLVDWGLSPRGGLRTSCPTLKVRSGWSSS